MRESGGREEERARGSTKSLKKGKVVDGVGLWLMILSAPLCTCVGPTDIFNQIQAPAEQAIHRHLSFNQTASRTGSKNKKKSFISVVG